MIKIENNMSLTETQALLIKLMAVTHRYLLMKIMHIYSIADIEAGLA